MNEIRLNNMTFISYSDFDEYDKFNGYYSEGNEEEDINSDASTSSYDEDQYENEHILYNYDLLIENFYECVMLGREHQGISLIR
mgnify:CR=1 FL=1